MNFPVIAISIFVFLETLNIIILYFAPTSDKGNGVGVFNAYQKSKEIPEVHNFVKYLINWVAGTKLIFVCLLLVIIFTGSPTTIFYSIIALVISIASFFWRLFPLIKQMDKDQQITPKGYSKTLFVMILVFVVALTIAAVYSYMSL